VAKSKKRSQGSQSSDPLEQWEAEHDTLSEEQWEKILEYEPEPYWPPDEVLEEQARQYEKEQKQARAFKRKFGITLGEAELRWSTKYNRDLRRLLEVDKLMTVSELADLLRISPRSIRNQMSRGKWPIPWSKHAGRVLFRRDDVVAHLLSVTTPTKE